MYCQTKPNTMTMMEWKQTLVRLLAVMDKPQASQDTNGSNGSDVPMQLAAAAASGQQQQPASNESAAASRTSEDGVSTSASAAGGSGTQQEPMDQTGPSAPAAAAGEMPILNNLETYIKTLNDPTQRDDQKLKVLQDISANLESLAPTAAYPVLIDNLLRIFEKLFTETQPQFIGENNTQQLRKLMLEITHRIPFTDYLKTNARNLTRILFNLIQTENEENVLVAIRILIDLIKQYRPPFDPEVSQLLRFCKQMYRDLEKHLENMFEPRQPLCVSGIQKLAIEDALRTAYAITPIQTEQKLADGSYVVYTLLPRCTQSLKVLCELPLLVVLLYQVHKQHVQSDIAEFIPLILQTIALMPPSKHRMNPNFNRDLFVDFLSAQVKALSFLAFLARIFLDLVSMAEPSLVLGIVQLLELCPSEVASLRRELLIGTRHLLASDLRLKFVPNLRDLFNERLMVGNGWTANETLRPLVYSMLADLVHHIRNNLNITQVVQAVQLFSRCLHDPSLPGYVRAMCCKVMMNLVECIVVPPSALDPHLAGRHNMEHIAPELLVFMLEVFVRKFKLIAQHHLPAIMAKFDEQGNLKTTTPAAAAAVPKKCNGKSSSEQTTTSGSVESLPASAQDADDDDSLDSAPDPTGKAADAGKKPLSIDTGSGSGQQSVDNTKKSAAQITAAYWGVPSQTLAINDCRSLVKTLVGGVKSIIWGIAKAGADPGMQVSGPDTLTCARLLKYGLPCLDIYMIVQSASNQHQKQSAAGGVRSKEEKETLDHFAHAFTMLPPTQFKQILYTNIDFIVKRMTHNYALQLICNVFLVTAKTSPAFGTILLEYLLDRLEDMGTACDRSVLYLKLFKLVFQSVTCSAQLGLTAGENEQMLKPHLHRLVYRSMALALSAKEPNNYFLLLRQLFRSIGGGSHDMLYQEFLPLLPALLQKLNRLQATTVREQMRELFVELCLTVPVRLSSLLPYLPLLMDPLVCALNGSATLLQQGLRTLELCVDNLQPEYLYEHMAPVRASLMQALWRTVSNDDRETSKSAFRILSKFGGSNRKMLADPQQLTVRDASADSVGVRLVWPGPGQQQPQPPPHNQQMHNVAIVSFAPVVSSAPEMIRAELSVTRALSVVQSNLQQNNCADATKLDSWHLARVVLLTYYRDSLPVGPEQLDSANWTDLIDRWQQTLTTALQKRQDSGDGVIVLGNVEQPPLCSQQPAAAAARAVYVHALTAMFYAVWWKCLRKQVLPVFNAVVRSLALQILLEQTEPATTAADSQQQSDSQQQRPPSSAVLQPNSIDSGVLLDAVSAALSDAGKEYCHSAVLALTLVKNTLHDVIGLDKACELPFFERLVRRLCALCEESVFYTRLGGCAGLKFVLDNMPRHWLRRHALNIWHAFVHVLHGQYNEVSSGALDMAYSGLQQLLAKCFDGDTTTDDQLLCDLVRLAVRLCTSPIQYIHEQMYTLLDELVSSTGVSTSCALLTCARQHIEDIVHDNQLNLDSVSYQSQIAFLTAFSQWYSTEPLMFSFDPTVPLNTTFLEHLINLCGQDAASAKQAMDAASVPLSAQATDPVHVHRAAVCKALMACFVSCGHADKAVVGSWRDRIYMALLKVLTDATHENVMKCAYDCLSKSMTNVRVDRQLLHKAMRPMLSKLNELQKSLTLDFLLRLQYLTRLQPHTFNEKFCEQMVVFLRKSVDLVINQHQQFTVVARPNLPFVTDEMKCVSTVLNIIEQIPAASAVSVSELVSCVASGMQRLRLSPCNAWLTSLLAYLVRFPNEAIEYFVSAEAQDGAVHGLFVCVLKQPAARPLRAALTTNASHLCQLIKGAALQTDAKQWVVDSNLKYSVEWFGLRIASILCTHDEGAFTTSASAPAVFDLIRQKWNDAEFRDRYASDEVLDTLKFSSPKLAVRCLLVYFQTDTVKLIDLLFECVHCFARKPTAADYTFVRTFIESTVVPDYSVDWRRAAFQRFVALYKQQPSFADEHAVSFLLKLVQYIILPCLAYSFEHLDNTEALIGSEPAPDTDNADNLVSLFVTQVIGDPKTKSLPDGLHVVLYQLSCLLVEHAPQHIHDTNSKRQGSRLRKFMLFAWPCLQNGQQDPTVKYNGHLLIAHIIHKFAINRKIVLQVFHSLLKAHGQEPRSAIRQALSILTPAVPQRMDDGHQQLIHFAKKIILEESHTSAQLVHLLQLMVRHYKIYFAVRAQLTPCLLNAIHKLITNHANLENRKLAVDVCEMIIKWELYRLKEAGAAEGNGDGAAHDPDLMNLLLSPPTAGSPASVCAPTKTQLKSVDTTTAEQCMDKQHVDEVVNMLVRMAAQTPEQLPPQPTSSTIEALNRRSLHLLKVSLRPEVWGNVATVKLGWMEKTLALAESSYRSGPQISDAQAQANTLQIHICLDVLSYLVTILPAAQVVPAFAPIQKNLATCLWCANTQVVRSLYTLLSRLLAVLDCTHTGFIDLDEFNSYIIRFVNQTLHNFDKVIELRSFVLQNNSSSVTALYGAMTVLKGMCTAQPSFLNQCLGEFMGALCRLVREHTGQTPGDVKSAADIISLCLDLLRPRLCSVQGDYYKMVTGSVLGPLIDRTSSARVLLSVIKLVEQWLTNVVNEQSGSTTGDGTSSTTTTTTSSSNNSSQLREKLMLLYKVQQCVDKRFGGTADAEQIERQLLTTVLYVYGQPALYHPDVQSRLEPSFHAGLMHADATFAAKFVDILDRSIARDPYDRLWHLMCQHNWSHCRQYYWIRIAVQLILATVDQSQCLRLVNACSLMPLPTATATGVGSQPAATERSQSQQAAVGESAAGPDTPMDVDPAVQSTTVEHVRQNISLIVAKQRVQLERGSELQTSDYVRVLRQLCAVSDTLSTHVWLQLIPALWAAFTNEQRDNLAHEVTPFLASGVHLAQTECVRSALATWVDALAACQPPVTVKPALLKYLAETHGVWHRSLLLLDAHLQSLESSAETNVDDKELSIERNDTLDNLADLYASLCETDMWRYCWTKRAKSGETVRAMRCAQFGQHTSAVHILETAMSRMQTQLQQAPTQIANPAMTQTMLNEMNVWETEWIASVKELNQWDVLKDYANHQAVQDPLLLVECAWRMPHWQLMNEALLQLEQSCSPENGWKLYMYQGYSAVTQQFDDVTAAMQAQQSGSSAPFSIAPAAFNVVQCVEQANQQLISQWRRLPHCIAPSHVPILQAAQRVQELAEANQVAASIVNAGAPLNASTQTSLVNDIKSIIKTWRNRAPTSSDSLTHWYDVFTWRIQHYVSMLALFDTHDGQQQHSLLPIHSCAWCLVSLSKVCRYHGQVEVAQDLLNRLHTMPTLPTMDSWLKVYQQIKCLMRATTDARTKRTDHNQVWAEITHIVDNTNISYFNKEQNARLYALKGTALGKLQRADEANKAFSASLQLADNLNMAWGRWGEHLQAVSFSSRADLETSFANGLNALVCFLQAARVDQALKSRKHMARALWLLANLSQLSRRSVDFAAQLSQALRKYACQVQANNWLPWLPQLMACVHQYAQPAVAEIVLHVANAFPQAVFHQLNARLPHPLPDAVVQAELALQQHKQQQQMSTTSTDDSSSATAGGSSLGKIDQLEGSTSTELLARILCRLEHNNATNIAATRTIVNQLSALHVDWSESLYSALQRALTEAADVAHTHRHSLQSQHVTADMSDQLLAACQQARRIDPLSNGGGDHVSEAEAVRDELICRLETELCGEAAIGRRLAWYIGALVRWQHTLNSRIQQLPTQLRLRDMCPYVCLFTDQQAVVQLPLESHTHKGVHYAQHIARFSPSVVRCRRAAHSPAHRLTLFAHNGRVGTKYTFLVEPVADVDEDGSQQRVAQLFRFLNALLLKDCQTARRLLYFAPPTSIRLGRSHRLIHTEQHETSLIDLLQQHCSTQSLSANDLVVRYVERLQIPGGLEPAKLQALIVKDTISQHVPRHTLQRLVMQRLPDPTHYYTFRNQMLIHMSLLSIAETALHLKQLNAEDLMFHWHTGVAFSRGSAVHIKFNDANSAELDNSERAVTCRLTPSLAHFLTASQIDGQMWANMTAAAKCWYQAVVAALLRPILWHEFIEHMSRHHDEAAGGHELLTMVARATGKITSTLSSYALFDTHAERTPVHQLLANARQIDNLAAMPPHWQPWF